MHKPKGAGRALCPWAVSRWVTARLSPQQSLADRLFLPPLPLSLPKASESPSRAAVGPVVLAVTVAVPICVLSLVAVLAACICQGRRCARGRTKPPNVEEPLSECNLVSSGKTLKDLIYDMTTSGSGSGMWASVCAASPTHRHLSCIWAIGSQNRSRLPGAVWVPHPCRCPRPLVGPRAA